MHTPPSEWREALDLAHLPPLPEFRELHLLAFLEGREVYNPVVWEFSFVRKERSALPSPILWSVSYWD